MVIEENNTVITEEPSMKNNGKIKVVLCTILIAALAGSGFWYAQNKNYLGTDNAKVTGDIIDVSVKVSGTLETMSVAEGVLVESGQMLAEIDASEFEINLSRMEASLELAQSQHAGLSYDINSLQAAVDSASASVNAAQARLKIAETNMQDTQRNYEQNEILYEQGAVSREVFDNTRSLYDKSQASLEAAQADLQSARIVMQRAENELQAARDLGEDTCLAQIKQAQAAYDSARYTIENTIIKSPVDGMIIMIASHTGEQVNAGQTLFSICDLESTRVTANIEEKNINRIKIGQQVEVTIDAYPGIKFQGSISKIGGATQSTFSIIPTENTSGSFTKVIQRIPVEVSLDKQDKIIKPGMSAVIRIHTSEKV